MLFPYGRLIFRYRYQPASLLVLFFLFCIFFFLSGCSALNLSGKVSRRSFPPITDSPTKTYHYGKFVWADLITPDTGRAEKFYSALFGWSFSQHDHYILITNN